MSGEQPVTPQTVPRKTFVELLLKKFDKLSDSDR